MMHSGWGAIGWTTWLIVATILVAIGWRGYVLWQDWLDWKVWRSRRGQSRFKDASVFASLRLAAYFFFDSVIFLLLIGLGIWLTVSPEPVVGEWLFRVSVFYFAGREIAISALTWLDLRVRRLAE